MVRIVVRTGIADITHEFIPFNIVLTAVRSPLGLDPILVIVSGIIVLKPYIMSSLLHSPFGTLSRHSLHTKNLSRHAEQHEICKTYPKVQNSTKSCLCLPAVGFSWAVAIHRPKPSTCRQHDWTASAHSNPHGRDLLGAATADDAFGTPKIPQSSPKELYKHLALPEVRTKARITALCLL
jgi:hypothetical protein